MNVIEVHSFLGLADYYRRFIKGFLEIARAMTANTERKGIQVDRRAMQTPREEEKTIRAST